MDGIAGSSSNATASAPAAAARFPQLSYSIVIERPSHPATVSSIGVNFKLLTRGDDIDTAARYPAWYLHHENLHIRAGTLDQVHRSKDGQELAETNFNYRNRYDSGAGSAGHWWAPQKSPSGLRRQTVSNHIIAATANIGPRFVRNSSWAYPLGLDGRLGTPLLPVAGPCAVRAGARFRPIAVISSFW